MGPNDGFPSVSDLITSIFRPPAFHPTSSRYSLKPLSMSMPNFVYTPTYGAMNPILIASADIAWGGGHIKVTRAITKTTTEIVFNAFISLPPDPMGKFRKG